jgi:hypothetical protein
VSVKGPDESQQPDRPEPPLNSAMNILDSTCTISACRATEGILCQTTPARDQLAGANALEPNPRGAIMVTHEPLAEIGR